MDFVELMATLCAWSPNSRLIAIFIEWTRSSLRIVVARGKSAHGRKTADTHGSDGSLRTTGNHHIGVTSRNDAKRVAYSMRSRRARCTRRGVRPSRPETY